MSAVIDFNGCNCNGCEYDIGMDTSLFSESSSSASSSSSAVCHPLPIMNIGWTCPTCTFINENGDICNICNYNKSFVIDLTEEIKKADIIICPKCTCHNNSTSKTCIVCDASFTQEPSNTGVFSRFWNMFKM